MAYKKYNLLHILTCSIERITVQNQLIFILFYDIFKLSPYIFIFVRTSIKPITCSHLWYHIYTPFYKQTLWEPTQLYNILYNILIIYHIHFSSTLLLLHTTSYLVHTHFSSPYKHKTCHIFSLLLHTTSYLVHTHFSSSYKHKTCHIFSLVITHIHLYKQTLWEPTQAYNVLFNISIIDNIHFSSSLLLFHTASYLVQSGTPYTTWY